jgi:hypothetical protein
LARFHHYIIRGVLSNFSTLVNDCSTIQNNFSPLLLFSDIVLQAFSKSKYRLVTNVVDYDRLKSIRNLTRTAVVVKVGWVCQF